MINDSLIDKKRTKIKNETKMNYYNYSESVLQFFFNRSKQMYKLTQ